jgi:hypothetical protein
MSDLPVWSEEFGRKFLELFPWAKAVSVDEDGEMHWFSSEPVRHRAAWQSGTEPRDDGYLGRVALPEGANWRDCIVVREPEKPPEAEPPAVAHAELPEWVEPMVRQAQSLEGWSAQYDSPLWATLLPSQGLHLAGLLIEEIERLRGKEQQLLDWGNDLAARCNGLTHSHERLVVTTDRVRAEVSQLRAQLAELPRNADGDVVFPPCDMWWVRESRPVPFRVQSIERFATSDPCFACGLNLTADARYWVLLSDLYSTEASARKAAEEAKQ